MILLQNVPSHIQVKQLEARLLSTVRMAFVLDLSNVLFYPPALQL